MLDLCIFLSWFRESNIMDSVLMMICLLQTQLSTLKDVNWCTRVMWIIMMFLISCLNSHSDGTHSLQRILWWTSDVLLNFSKSIPIKKTNLSTSWKTWGWINFKQIVIFGWTIPGCMAGALMLTYSFLCFAMGFHVNLFRPYLAFYKILEF